MRISKTLVPLLLIAGMLVSCNSGKGSVTTKNTAKDEEEKNDSVVLTQQKTPTPVLPADQIQMGGGNEQRPGGNQEENNPAEQGEGAELEGYYQLLGYIDRDSVMGPEGWSRHPAIDMLDGLFETTDEGSNKYGQNLNQVNVYWSMTRSVTVNAYAIYTANDAETHPARNPKNWTLYGSDDGEEWQTIHSVQDAGLPSTNYTGTVYEFDNTEAYRYYCWSLEAVEGDGAFQLSELLLYTTEELSDPPIEGGVGEFYGKLPAFGQVEQGKEATPLVGDEALEWMDAHHTLSDKVDVDSAFFSAKCWADNEGPDRLFDGIYTEEEFGVNNGGKLGASIDRGYVIWKMEEAVSPNGYVLVTGNDTSEYPDRNPVSWVLYGSNDGKAWEALDVVKNGNMQGLDFAPHVYTVENDDSYTWFCLAIEKANGGMQLCELILVE